MTTNFYRNFCLKQSLLHRCLAKTVQFPVSCYHPVSVKSKSPGKSATNLLQITNKQVRLCQELSVLNLKRNKFQPKHKEDGVSPSYELVMDNSLKNYIIWYPPFIYGIMTPTGVFSIYNVLTKFQNFESLNDQVALTMCLSVFSALIISTTWAVVSRCFLRMYYEPETKKFIGVIQQWNMTRKLLEFTIKDCERMKKSEVLGYFLGNVKIKKSRFMSSVDDFKLPQYYNLILGYHIDRKEETDILRTKIMGPRARKD